MEQLLEYIPFFEKFGPGVFIPVILFALVAILAQWSLYDKCGQPGYACLVPVWNVITFLKIVGRPAWQSLIVMIPPPMIIGFLFIENPTIAYTLATVTASLWIAFMIKVYIEIVQCFGHYKTIDYILVSVFNGFYVLHLGLSYKEKYRGPVHGPNKVAPKKKSKAAVKSQLA